MPLLESDQQELLQYITKKNLNITHHVGWENFTKTQHDYQALVLDVNDIKSLQKLIIKISLLNHVKAPDHRITYHAAAGGRKDVKVSESNSFTNCAVADIMIRLVGKEFIFISGTDQTNVLKVGASVQQYELDRIAYEKFHLCTATSTLIGSVTMGGISGTNGTGRDQPGVAGLIKAMTLMMPNGKIVRLDESHPQFRTLMGAHLGLLGIILDIEIQCMPAKKMLRKCIPMTIQEFDHAVQNGLFQREEYIGVMHVPFGKTDEWSDNKHKQVIVRTMQTVSTDTPDKNNHPTLSHFAQALEIDLNEELEIMELIRQFPKLYPYFNKYFVATLEVGESTSEAVGPQYDMYHYQSTFPRGFVDGGRMFEASADGREFSAFYYHYVKTLEKFAAKGLYPLAYPSYFRYLKGTNGGLSPTAHAAGKRVVAIDMPSLPYFPGYQDFVKEMDDNFFFANLRGKKVYNADGEIVNIKTRVHPGKDFDLPKEYLEKMFGDELPKFIKAVTEWHHENGLDFDASPLKNDFADKIFSSSPTKKLAHSLKESAHPSSFIDAKVIANKILNKDILPASKYGLKLKTQLENICKGSTLSDKPAIVTFALPTGSETTQDGVKNDALCKKCMIM